MLCKIIVFNIVKFIFFSFCIFQFFSAFAFVEVQCKASCIRSSQTIDIPWKNIGGLGLTDENNEKRSVDV